MILPLPSASPAATSRCPFSGAELPAVQTSVHPLFPGTAPLDLESEATDFLALMQRENVLSPDAAAARMVEVRRELTRYGTYWQTLAELEHGAKVAWRNSAKCIGRLYWQKLNVRDLRDLTSAEEIFHELVEHLRLATNEGKIQSTISVFSPQAPGSQGIRIWNPQLIRYAGYRQPDGTIIGDPLQVEFTEIAKQLGWKGGAGTRFDLLPVIIQMPGRKPELFELPQDAVLEVPLSHPEYPWFAELGLKWHALPVISGMRMEIGGISYPAAPFNGWYMGAEIGARNLADVDRYDLLPVVAREMGLDTRSNRKLWRDRAMVELNVAVLHSFQEQGVAIIDHHTASKHFLRFEEEEQRCERPVPADWSWLVPPISGSASPLFHREYHDTELKPNYFYQPNAWHEARYGLLPRPAAVEPERPKRDTLTGLLHRDALERQLAAFRRDGGVVALVDLDRFEKVGATYGQPASNAVLAAAARVVLATVRPDDTCARYGNDTFCLLLSGVEGVPEAEAIGARVQDALRSMAVREAPAALMTASVGVAFVAPGGDAAAGLKRAEQALRRASEAGGARTVVDAAPEI